MRLVTTTNISLSLISPEAGSAAAQPRQTPISRRIDTLLGLSTLNPYERMFLLKVKCRECPLISAEELKALANIWAIRMGGGV